MIRETHPHPETPCQDCRSRPWTVGVATPQGYVYLCAPDAAQAIDARESKSPVRQAWWATLLVRVFGGAA